MPKQWSLLDSLIRNGIRSRIDGHRLLSLEDKMSKSLVKIPVERIEKAIFLIRGEKVMLDRDLAALYGVPTKALKTSCAAE